ncbi:histone acetyltransferase [Rhizophlyctis rosea]|uniref:Histone acetyltransferase n=1 Tax=Rhizophlyctis rosea TaxID=64517 RepID=A0AAD5X364_9FUNG|nr:histone acetyltransferase [Rhizophlyctis rosea]
MDVDYVEDQEDATEPVNAASSPGVITNGPPLPDETNMGSPVTVTNAGADWDEDDIQPHPKRRRVLPNYDSEEDDANRNRDGSAMEENANPDEVSGVSLDDILKAPEEKHTAPGQGYVGGDEETVDVADGDEEDDEEAAAEPAEAAGPTRIHRGGAGGAAAYEAAVAAAKADDTNTSETSKPKVSKAEEAERRGEVYYRVVENDGSDESMILLTGLKNIFQRQLPKMPKEYIARLVYDRNHRSMAAIRRPMNVVAGITYRPFPKRRFAEIVFCAVASHEQVAGFGKRLMGYTKDHVTTEHDVKYFLTYADNYATGYFRKQGFTTEITLDKSVWVGYIKDYEGGTIMQCTILDKFKYLKSNEILTAQRKAVFDKIKQASHSSIVYPGLQHFKNGATRIDPADIPGLKEAGWTPEMETRDVRKPPKVRGPLYRLMRALTTEMQTYKDCWPFVEPVSGVADYYDIIKQPMDLRTMEGKVEEGEYATIDDFTKDMVLIFQNCRLYNAPDSTYFRW